MPISSFKSWAFALAELYAYDDSPNLLPCLWKDKQCNVNGSSYHITCLLYTHGSFAYPGLSISVIKTFRSPGTCGYGRRCPPFFSKNMRTLRTFWTCGHLRTHLRTPGDTWGQICGHGRSNMSSVSAVKCPQFFCHSADICGHVLYKQWECRGSF